VIDEGLERGASVLDVQLGVIQEAQREIGRLWQENSISVAQEHLATAISNMALSHLYDHASRARTNGKKVIVACVEGELHDFPARLVADALDLAGFDVRYLGASVPTDSLLSFIREERPDLVALSVTMTFNLPSLRATCDRLRKETAGALPIAIGGNACRGLQETPLSGPGSDASPRSGDVAAELNADATGVDAAEVVDAVCKLLGVTRD
jgi:methanogenic corrinoid protein MtbC1